MRIGLLFSAYMRGVKGKNCLDGLAESLPAGCPAIVPGCAKTGRIRQMLRDAYLDGQEVRRA